MEKLPIGGGKELAGLRVLGPDAAFRPVPDREGDASACVRGGKPNIGKERSARKWRQFGRQFGLGVMDQSLVAVPDFGP